MEAAHLKMLKAWLKEKVQHLRSSQENYFEWKKEHAYFQGQIELASVMIHEINQMVENSKNDL